MSSSDARGADPRGTGAVDIVGDSPQLRTVRERIARVAPTGTTVLITGGLGVGKELVARAIHQRSPRAALPFVALSGGALPAAIRDSDAGGGGRTGRAAAAEPGTLYLPDVGELGAADQAALLRFLKERRFRRARGGGEGAVAAPRLVVATTRNLAGMVEDGAFRRDLFYCVNVFAIHVPPLAARPGDVVPLARHFVDRFARETGRDLRGLSPAAERVLETHAWPGNVGELENVVERAAVLEESDRLQARSLELDDAPGPDRSPGSRAGGELDAAAAARPPGAGMSADEPPFHGGPDDGAGRARPDPVEPLPESGFVLEDHVRSLERDYLDRALRQAGGVKVRAAGLLGMSFRSFRYYAKKYDLG